MAATSALGSTRPSEWPILRIVSVVYIATLSLLARRNGTELTPALGVPFAVAVLFVAIVNSAFVTLRHGGVRWRGTLYPLEKLREGQVN